VVACSSHLPSKSRGLAALGGSGGATCPDDGARAASNHLSVDGSLQWNRWLGVEFQEVVRVVLYLGESYIVMRMDSSTDSHMVLIHPSKILFGFWKRDKNRSWFVTIPSPIRKSPSTLQFARGSTGRGALGDATQDWGGSRCWQVASGAVGGAVP
jgi:hypothetical protein